MFGFEPLSDAVGVEVMFDVARQRCDGCFLIEWLRADDALSVLLKFFGVVDHLRQAVYKRGGLRLLSISSSSFALPILAYLFENVG